MINRTCDRIAISDKTQLKFRATLQSLLFQAVENLSEEFVSAVKKSILYLGRPLSDIDKVRDSLAQRLGPQASPIFVLAKDGPDAALKAGNQKFDAVVINPQASRLQEGGFLSSLKTHQNTSHAGLIVVAPEPHWEVPEHMQNVDEVLDCTCTEEVLAEALAKVLKLFEKSKPASFAVDVKVLNALIKATKHVISQFGISSVTLQKPEAKAASPDWKGEMGASIAIKSRQFQGLLVISFDESLYLKIVSSMLMEEQTAVNAENADAIGEISNMILGNAKSDFTDYDIEMSLPVLLAKGTSLQFAPGSVQILLPGSSPEGVLYLQVLAYPLVSLS